MVFWKESVTQIQKNKILLRKFLCSLDNKKSLNYFELQNLDLGC